ncbi:MAG: Asp-tRNA(Asn)/Glu-tRNA(Gln) amidotransferase subunit GatC [Microgenomates group bacterium]
MVKTKITKEAVAKVAKLANLSLTDSEIEKFTPQLAEIFGYINQLDEVDTAKTHPTAQVSNLNNVTREDTIDENQVLDQKEALGQSAKTEKNMFVAKAVIAND